ncbi:MAG: hypothetical protein FD149_2097 [Rhodospirillaceae bacterium]|nr:MAG: hypothetical protein FD149_2097 [Rhodospirillaceae bacterium]
MGLSSRFPWLEPSMREIRMLRVEDNNELMPAVQQGARNRVP